MKTLTASDRTSLIRLASALPKGSTERREILAGLQKVAGYDKGVWKSVPAKARGPILKHLGRPRQPGRSDPIPYYSGWPRTAFKPVGKPLTIQGHTFIFGSDGNEAVVQWDSPSGTGFFLEPMPG